MRIGLLTTALGAVLALSACGPAQTTANTQAPAAPTTAATGDWAGFRDGFIDGWFRIDPANAVYQGKHEYDGGLGDWSAAGLKRQADFLHGAIDKAGAFKDL